MTIESLPAQRCAGMDHVGSYMGIDHATGRLFAEVSARGALCAQPAMKGVFFDDPDLGPEKRHCAPAPVCRSRTA